MASNAKGRERNRRILGAMVHALDQGVGRILDAIHDKGIYDNTFVLFTSDNGGVRGIGENTPFRGGKATVFEGGIRVVAAVRWPARIPRGRKIDAPLANIDILPTLMRMAGVQGSVDKPMDGLDVLDVLTGRQESLERDLFNYIGQDGLDHEHVSYMTNDWKMIVYGRDVTDAGSGDGARQQFLFNISEDPSEERNLIDAEPARAAAMFEKIKQFRALQPEGAVVPYAEGRRDPNFKPPPDWRMPGD